MIAHKTIISATALLALAAPPAPAKTNPDSGAPSGSEAEAAMHSLGDAVGQATEVAAGLAEQAGGAIETAKGNVAAAAGGGTQVPVDRLIGAPLVAASGKEVGQIDRVVQFDGERVAVAEVGGFLGFGERRVALPLSELVFDGEAVGAPGYTERQLRDLSELDPDLATDLPAGQEVSLGKS